MNEGYKKSEKFAYEVRAWVLEKMAEDDLKPNEAISALTAMTIYIARKTKDPKAKWQLLNHIYDTFKEIDE